MKLYTYFRSSAAFRVRIALNYKNLDYDAVPVHLKSGAQKAAEYVEKNPQGLVPLLEDGTARISQSYAILEYLEETRPRPSLLPGDPAGRALVRAMAQLVACDIHPLNNLRVLKYLKSSLGHDQAEIDTWYRHWIAEGFTALERLVQPAAADQGYCFGDQITLADVCLAPQIWNARRFECDLSPFPKLLAIDAKLQQHPAFKKAAPENQFDAE